MSHVAYITRATTQLDTKPAPFMAAFSSNGPNLVTPEILKPDITAPEVSIMAAYGPSNQQLDKSLFFNLLPGTSMSCWPRWPAKNPLSNLESCCNQICNDDHRINSSRAASEISSAQWENVGSEFGCERKIRAAIF